jgi:hypothetical protein
MWAKGTTIKQLEDMADKGLKLPEIVLVKGVIDADGPPVGSLTRNIDSLRPLIGQIDQPPNMLIDYGKMVVRGDVKIAGIDKDVVKDVKDDYSKRSTKHFDSKFILTDLLVTRLACWAYKEEEEDKPDKIFREAREARFLVHHSRA